MVHHTIIWKQVNKLLAKGFIEPWIGGAGCYSSLNSLNASYTYLLLRCLQTGMVPYLARWLDFFYLS